MSSGVHLGRCLFVSERFARIEPLLTATSAGWVVPEDKRQAFPDVGKVFSLDRSILGTGEGTVWQFGLEANSRYRSGADQDRWLATEAREPVETIDMSGASGMEVVRRSLVEQGLAPEHVPTRHVVVILSGGRCIHLRLDRDPATRRWRSIEGAADLLPVHVFDPSMHAGAALEGRRYIRPGHMPSEVVGHVDWSSDVEFLSKVARRLRRTASFQAGGELGDVTRRMVERMVAALRDAEMLSGDARSNEAVSARLADLLPDLSANLAAVDEIARALLDTPSIVARLETAVATARDEAAERLRRDLEPVVAAQVWEAHADARAEVDAVRAEVVPLSMRADALRREVAEILAERDVQRVALEGDLESLATVLSRAADALASGSRMTAPDTAATPVTERVPGAAPWSNLRTSGTVVGIALTELGPVLAERERLDGFPTGNLLCLDVLARAGEIPMLFGDDAERMVRAYAECVAGGIARRMPLDATVLGIDDLWLRASDASRTALATAWSLALETPAGTFLVVFDDLDASFVSDRLPRLLDGLAGAGRPSNLLLVATASQSAQVARASLAALRRAVPLACSGDAGGAMAALASLGNEGERTVRRLVDPVRRKATTQAASRLATALMGTPCIKPGTAVRAHAVMESALSTMAEDEATALALEVAALADAEEPASVPARPVLAQGLILLAERCRAGPD